MSMLVPKLTAVVRNLAMAGALCAGFATAAQAVTFTEVGDAGESVANAQKTTGGAGALTDIFGSISSSLDADLYIITITSAGSFSATTVNGASSSLDTQLFLFTLAGAPVYTNDDAAGGLSLNSTLAAGNAFGPVTGGQYILGISISGYNPVNINSQALFAMGLSTDTRGPASGLQPATLGKFVDSTYEPESGAYDIQLTGASIAAVPEPSTYALMLLGVGALAFAAARRRRDDMQSSKAAA